MDADYSRRQRHWECVRQRIVEIEAIGLIQRLGMEALLSLEVVTQAAPNVLAVVFSPLYRFLFRGSGPQTNPSQAFRTAEGVFL